MNGSLKFEMRAFADGVWSESNSKKTANLTLTSVRCILEIKGGGKRFVVVLTEQLGYWPLGLPRMPSTALDEEQNVRHLPPPLPPD